MVRDQFSYYAGGCFLFFKYSKMHNIISASVVISLKIKYQGFHSRIKYLKTPFSPEEKVLAINFVISKS